MRQANAVSCPRCHNNHLQLKYEVTYEYSYTIDANAPGECNHDEFLPYLYDNREQKEARQTIKCQTCGASFPCYFTNWQQGISTAALQKALQTQ